MMNLETIETATRDELADELGAAGEYTEDWETATMEDLRERVVEVVQSHRQTTDGTITWHEDESSGRGYLTLRCADGGQEEVQWDEPITASSDSDDIVSHFEGYEWQTISHDGEYVHVRIIK